MRILKRNAEKTTLKNAERKKPIRVSCLFSTLLFIKLFSVIKVFFAAETWQDFRSDVFVLGRVIKFLFF